MKHDADIEALNISGGEKDGLQIFRNYKKSFDKRAAENFLGNLDSHPFDLEKLKSFFNSVESWDAERLLVKACAYADDLLVEMYELHIPKDALAKLPYFLGPTGPLGTFFQRLCIADAFGRLAADVCQRFDRYRKCRNKASHSVKATDPTEEIASYLIQKKMDFELDQLFKREGGRSQHGNF